LDIISGISENKFVLVLLSEEQYEKKLIDIIKTVEKSHSRICYVCLSRPYNYVLEQLTRMGFGLEKFFFIDVLTSHYKKPAKASNCLFLDDPIKLNALEAAISKVLNEKNCSVVIFDTISSLLVYEQSHEIIKFTHKLTMEKKEKDTNKVFIVLKYNNLVQDYQQSLIKDVAMFADKTIDMEKI
jgi:archaellum biogenesis ATPase FlaH